ncbi:MAG: hypothetical protein IIB07_10335 [Bacteroidetes bacterium]|nr:hypothetical protein [Bacteroidota bacterium]MCH8171506.1 hypothetical protein [Bacteroidota bacterium]MCH8941351.1 hypothetical protein [Bacteroidota bacterium]
MPKKVKRKKSRSTLKIASPFKIYWGKKNYYMLFLGIAVLIIGFYFMSVGNWDSTVSLFISPFILMIGYLLIIPASILVRKNKKEQNSQGK